MAKQKKQEMEILSPGIRVGGYEVRPWTFEQFLNVLPSLISIGAILQEKQIDFDKIGELVKDPIKLSDLLRSIGSIVPTIVSETLGISIELVKKMDFDQATSIALVIFIQNAEKIKNFSGLGKTAFRSLMSGV